MKKKEIEKNNKLIAGFMDEPYYMDENGLGLKSKITGWNGEDFEDLPLSYNFSWNWLMPVAQEIEKRVEHLEG